MRQLFISESRTLQSVIKSKWNVSITHFDHAVKAIFVEPRLPGAPRFNVDFVLEFVERPLPAANTACASVSILPNCIGPSVNVLVDTVSYRPLLFELMFGDSFEIKYFKEHVKK